MIRVVTGCVAILALTACVSLGIDPSESILGRWQTEVGGFPVIVSYDRDMVTVEGSEPVPYSLSGNELRFSENDSHRRVVSFPSADEMHQLDPLSGTDTIYRRLD